VGEQGEAAPGSGVTASGERCDLKGDVGVVGLLYQVCQLRPLYLRPAQWTAQRRLVDHGPQRGWVGCGQKRLAA
jgi:hypothetical protein